MLAGGRLDVAHRRARRARRGLPHGVRHGDARGDRELRGDGRGQRRRTAGDPRLVDAGRRRPQALHSAPRPMNSSTSVRTSRLGESCSALRSGCHRCPTAWPSSRAAGDSAARGPDAGQRRTERPRGAGPGGARATAAHCCARGCRRSPTPRPGWPRRAPRSRPAPDRSRSTPSGPPATATPVAPTSSSSAARAPAPGWSTRSPSSRWRRWPRRSSGTEWILHAATQDLPCLADVGLRPGSLFDTELAGRLLGYPRVGLATLVETVLGGRMKKEHSAVDWSRRPLPEPWLEYAALDVEVLVELRDALAAQLVEAGKDEWARQEFEAPALLRGRRRAWRRGAVRRGCTGSAAVAAWVRCGRSGRLATSWPSAATSRPGRIIPDSAIVAAAQAMPTDRDALLAVKGFHGRGAERYASRWVAALRGVAALDEAELPTRAPRSDGPPLPRAWADRDPVAARRLSLARQALGDAGRAAGAAGRERAHPRLPAPGAVDPARHPGPDVPGRRRRRRALASSAPGPGRSGSPARSSPRPILEADQPPPEPGADRAAPSQTEPPS